MPSNQAAYLIDKSRKPLLVKSAPYTPPNENEIVVRNGAVAINPIDYIKQAMGNLLFGWIKYPFVIGSDLAGEVVEVGKGVTRFKVGDRVLGHAVGMDQRSNKSSEGAFQEYTVIRTNLASPIPDSMSYEDACVLPLCLSTAFCGMFMKDYLALQYPTVPSKPNGQTLLVWGGSTALGSNAIQLAIAAGYEVIATASPKNFDYVRKLGAIEVYDYRSKTVVKDIIRAFSNRECAGAIAIANKSMGPCIDIVATSQGMKFVAQASQDLPDTLPKSALDLALLMLNIVWFNVSLLFKSKIKGVGYKFIFGSDLMANEVGAAVYNDFLPTALAEGKYQAAPEPLVVGRGLENVQDAMNIYMKGVSAKKVVVSL